MEVKDLRIGNYVSLNKKQRDELWINNEICADKYYYSVDVIYGSGEIVLKLDAEDIDFDIKDIQPIPLTEEWLLKLGFEEKGDNKEESYFLLYGFHLENRANDKFSLNINKEDFGCWWIDQYLKELKYVHQLQNIFFCITGEELTIKN